MSKKLSGKYITVPFGRMLIGMKGHAASKFNGCVRIKLKGTHPGSQAAVWSAFSAAAKSCK